MSHWALQYIGRPWARGAQGPDAFDCWGFVRFVLLHHYSIEVPEIRVPERLHGISKLMTTSPELDKWTQTSHIEDGQVVLMARRNIPLHIGLSVRANGVFGILHCAEPAGVIFQTSPSIQASGFGRLTYYRYIA